MVTLEIKNQNMLTPNHIRLHNWENEKKNEAIFTISQILDCIDVVLDGEVPSAEYSDNELSLIFEIRRHLYSKSIHSSEY